MIKSHTDEYGPEQPWAIYWLKLWLATDVVKLFNSGTSDRRNWLRTARNGGIGRQNRLAWTTLL